MLHVFALFCLSSVCHGRFQPSPLGLPAYLGPMEGARTDTIQPDPLACAAFPWLRLASLLVTARHRASFQAPRLFSAQSRLVSTVGDVVGQQKIYSIPALSTWSQPCHVRLPPIVANESTSVGVDLDGMLTEAQRQLDRARKKMEQTGNRAVACEEKQAALLADENTPLEEYEALPNCPELREIADGWVQRGAELEKLVAGLSEVAADKDDGSRMSELLGLAESLGVGDKPPPRPPRGYVQTRKRGPRTGKGGKTRRPYRAYLSQDDAEIRVGKQAEDNDVLSTDAAHRDGNDWWLHASGAAGSHVVIRAESIEGAIARSRALGSEIESFQDTDLPREVALDAAVLALNYSKASLSGIVPVNLCRARQVSKPLGAKPGLVRLSGDVMSIRVDWKNEQHRLERLETVCSFLGDIAEIRSKRRAEEAAV